MKTASAHNQQLTGQVEPLDLTSRDIFRMIRNRIGFDRSDTWLDIVRHRPCVKCGNPGPSQAHHVFSGYHNAGKKSKTSDFATLPVCASCHDYLERHPEHNRECVVDLVLFLTGILAETTQLEERL